MNSTKALEVVITGANSTEATRLTRIVQSLGGRVVSHVRSASTVLVCLMAGSRKYLQARQMKAAIVPKMWVYESGSYNHFQPTATYEDKVGCFLGLRICITGFADTIEERDELKVQIETNGGMYCPDLEHNRTSCLVAGSTQSAKFTHACKWSIPTVTPKWLTACLDARAFVSFSAFMIRPRDASRAEGSGHGGRASTGATASDSRPGAASSGAASGDDNRGGDDAAPTALVRSTTVLSRKRPRPPTDGSDAGAGGGANGTEAGSAPRVRRRRKAARPRPASDGHGSSSSSSSASDGSGSSDDSEARRPPVLRRSRSAVVKPRRASLKRSATTNDLSLSQSSSDRRRRRQRHRSRRRAEPVAPLRTRGVAGDALPGASGGRRLRRQRSVGAVVESSAWVQQRADDEAAAVAESTLVDDVLLTLGTKDPRARDDADSSDDDDNDAHRQKQRARGSNVAQYLRAMTRKCAVRPRLYLSACWVHLLGFDLERRRRLVAMVRRGGGSRLDALHRDITHVVVAVDTAPKMVATARQVLPLARFVTAAWLVNCVQQNDCLDWLPYAWVPPAAAVGGKLPASSPISMGGDDSNGAAVAGAAGRRGFHSLAALRTARLLSSYRPVSSPLTASPFEFGDSVAAAAAASTARAGGAASVRPASAAAASGRRSAPLPQQRGDRVQSPPPLPDARAKSDAKPAKGAEGAAKGGKATRGSTTATATKRAKSGKDVKLGSKAAHEPATLSSNMPMQTRSTGGKSAASGSSSTRPSTVFEGRTFACVQVPDMEAVVRLIKKMGGAITVALTNMPSPSQQAALYRCDYVVIGHGAAVLRRNDDLGALATAQHNSITDASAVDDAGSNAVAARDAGPRLVSSTWLMRCQAEQRIVAPQSHSMFSPMRRTLPHRDMVGWQLAVSGYSGWERKYIRAAAQLLGATFINTCGTSTTLLVCKEPQGNKFAFAMRNRVPVVRVGWLWSLVTSTGSLPPKVDFALMAVRRSSLTLTPSHLARKASSSAASQTASQATSGRSLVPPTPTTSLTLPSAPSQASSCKTSGAATTTTVPPSIASLTQPTLSTRASSTSSSVTTRRAASRASLHPPTTDSILRSSAASVAATTPVPSKSAQVALPTSAAASTGATASNVKPAAATPKPSPSPLPSPSPRLPKTPLADKTVIIDAERDTGRRQRMTSAVRKLGGRITSDVKDADYIVGRAGIGVPHSRAMRLARRRKVPVLTVDKLQSMLSELPPSLSPPSDEQGAAQGRDTTGEAAKVADDVAGGKADKAVDVASSKQSEDDVMDKLFGSDQGSTDAAAPQRQPTGTHALASTSDGDATRGPTAAPSKGDTSSTPATTQGGANVKNTSVSEVKQVAVPPVPSSTAVPRQPSSTSIDMALSNMQRKLSQRPLRSKRMKLARPAAAALGGAMQKVTGFRARRVGLRLSGPRTGLSRVRTRSAQLVSASSLAGGAVGAKRGKGGSAAAAASKSKGKGKSKGKSKGKGKSKSKSKGKSKGKSKMRSGQGQNGDGGNAAGTSSTARMHSGEDDAPPKRMESIGQGALRVREKYLGGKWVTTHSQGHSGDAMVADSQCISYEASAGRMASLSPSEPDELPTRGAFGRSTSTSGRQDADEGEAAVAAVNAGATLIASALQEASMRGDGDGDGDDDALPSTAVWKGASSSPLPQTAIYAPGDQASSGTPPTTPAVSGSDARPTLRRSARTGSTPQATVPWSP